MGSNNIELSRCDVKVMLSYPVESATKRSKFIIMIHADKAVRPRPGQEEEPPGPTSSWVWKLYRRKLRRRPARARAELSELLDDLFCTELGATADDPVDQILEPCLKLAPGLPRHGRAVLVNVYVKILVDDDEDDDGDDDEDEDDDEDGDDDEDDDDDEDEDDEDYDDDEDIPFVAASKESIRCLESGTVEVTGQQCMVCCDDISLGSEAIRLPCSHYFHGDCILKWLNISKFCPICRFELSK